MTKLNIEYVVAEGNGKEGEVVSIYGSTFATERRDDKFDQVIFLTH